MIYVKHFDYIVLEIVSNLKNMIHTPIKLPNLHNSKEEMCKL